MAWIATNNRVDNGRTRFDPHWRGTNIAIPIAMLLYAAITALLCRAMDHAEDFRLDVYLSPFYVSYAFYGAIIGSALLVRKLLRRGDKRLLWFAHTWPIEEFVARLIAALPFLLMWPIFMSGFTSIKNLLNDTLPFTWDHTLATLGLLLHFGKPLWQWLAIDSPPVTLLLEFVYAFWGRAAGGGAVLGLPAAPPTARSARSFWSATSWCWCCWQCRRGQSSCPAAVLAGAARPASRSRRPTLQLSVARRSQRQLFRRRLSALSVGGAHAGRRMVRHRDFRLPEHPCRGRHALRAVRVAVRASRAYCLHPVSSSPS